MSTLGTAYVQIAPSAQGIKGAIEASFGDEPQKAGANLGSKLSGAIKTAIVAAGIGAAFSKSLSLGGDLQQSIGGVETMFGDAADRVIDNADKAFQTAGISANKYLEQVTSFSATLLQGLKGDTEAAVGYADMAIVDMSDNANKFGTDISSIQAAYQGFAKNNYTMLDNLKLGYGGTAGEMARLINDTEVLGTDVEVTAQTVKDVPFDKVIEAIHKVQEDLGVTGTTSVEAAETFSGSMGAMKAALENVFANAALGRDMQPALEGLATSVENFFLDNLFPMIENILASLPEIIDILGNVLGPMMPDIIDGVVQLLSAALTSLIEFIPEFVDGALTLAGAIIDALAKVDWGSVAMKALDAIKKAFEEHPIATTLALSLVGLKLSGLGISTVASMAMAKIKSLLITEGGLTPLGQGLQTVMQLALGFALVYHGISNYKNALDTDGIMDDVMSAVEGAFGGALIGMKVGGPLGAAIGASIVCAIELIVTLLHDTDQKQAAAGAAFQAVRDEWVNTGKVSEDQAAVIQAAFDSQSRGVRESAWELYDHLKNSGNMSEETAASIAYDFKMLAADMGTTVEGAASRAASAAEVSTESIADSTEDLMSDLEVQEDDFADVVEDAVKAAEDGADDIKEVTVRISKATQDSMTKVASSVSDMKDALGNAVKGITGWYDELEQKTHRTTDQLIANWEAHIKATEDWEKDLNTLLELGIDKGLIERFAKAGPAGDEMMMALQDALINNPDALPGLVAKCNELFEKQWKLEQGMNDEAQGVLHTVGVMTAGTEAELAELAALAEKFGVALPEGLADGINAAAPKTYLAVDTLKNKAISFDLYGAGYDIGANMINGIVRGINLNADSAVNAAATMANRTISKTRNIMAIASPSKIFIAIGKFLALGLAQGIQKNAYVPVDQAESMAEDVTDVVSGITDQRMRFMAAYAGISAFNAQRTAAGNNYTGNITLNVYAAKGQSEEAIAQAVMWKLQHNVNVKGAAWA